jgi:hypothetical protein
MAERRLTHKLGSQLVEGAQLRCLPQIELPWISTFNLRWWRHVEEESVGRKTGPRGKAGMPT